jgi:hypothetical protein
MSPDNKTVSAVPTATDTTQTSRKSAKGILCAKCEHVNIAGATTCNRCRSHLHIKCNDCGAINERALDHCRNCGRNLHRTILQRFTAKVSRSRIHLKPLPILLLFAVAGIIFYLVVQLTQFQLPTTQ